MPITVHLRNDDPERDERLALGFDSPRIVIGRARSAEVLLPDASVSARHASIRQRGTEYIVVDEGSTNGIQVGNVRLPAHTPRVLRHGEIVRVGRVWLEIELGVARATVGAARVSAEEVAARWLERSLRAAGEDMAPEVRVVAGPDTGRTLRLAEPGREYVLGRGREADLVLSDPNASRRHVGVTWDGGGVRARDLGSKPGSRLDGEPLGTSETEWRAPREIGAAGDTFALATPLADALAQALAAADVRMNARELDASPPWLAAEAAPRVEAPDEASAPDPDEAEALREERAEERETARRSGFGPIEVLALVLALGVLSLSAAGLAWLFGR
ncbi:MAG: FHA domain-containing protein [Polyangiaceae bacterium]|nr:FHA domain-containing protein [Polyangiaceae bacterium]